MKTFDVAVVGVGGMGSAACYHLSKAGLDVLGLEQFSIPNTRGSSHGSTRILRLGLHESSRYVPLVSRAAELWDDLGEQTGQKIFHRIGSLDVSLPEGPIFQGSLLACQHCGIEHEVLDAREIRRRHRAMAPAPGMMAVFQPGSGFVVPEAAISAHVNLAMAGGAEIRGHERMVGWENAGREYLIATEHGRYRARNLLIMGGAWIGKILQAACVPVEAERCVLGWFSTGKNAPAFSSHELPVWIVDSEETGHFYGFPAHGIPGFKLGRLREKPLPGVDPDMLRLEVDREDEADMRGFIRAMFPGADGPVLSMETCFFENTPDRTPIVDRIPGEESAWVIGGFSGHGFKYASAMGEVACALVQRTAPRCDLTPFRLSRFLEK